MMFEGRAVNIKNVSDLIIEKVIGAYRLRLDLGRHPVIIVLNNKEVTQALKNADKNSRNMFKTM